MLIALMAGSAGSVISRRAYASSASGGRRRPVACGVASRQEPKTRLTGCAASSSGRVTIADGGYDESAGGHTCRSSSSTVYGFAPPRTFDALVEQVRHIRAREGDTRLDGYLWQGKQYEGGMVNVLEALWANGARLLDASANDRDDTALILLAETDPADGSVAHLPLQQVASQLLAAPVEVISTTMLRLFDREGHRRALERSRPL